MTKYAQIPEIRSGVVFSDPFYDESVWCQYRKDFHAQDWLMSLSTKEDDGLLCFEMCLGRSTMCSRVRVVEEGENIKISYPSHYNMDSVELGMDTAQIFCGIKENWEQFGESASIHTGTDGLFGTLFIFTCHGEKVPAGYLLLGAIDPIFAREEDLFSSLVAGFDGQEITKEMYENRVSSRNVLLQMALAHESRIADEINADNMHSNAKDKGSER